MRRLGAKTVVFVVLALCAPAVASADQVVRFNTTLGNIDVQLLSEDAPNTVQNFLSYVNDPTHPYNGTVIHRVVHNFVIQGGGFTFDPTYTGATPKFRPILSKGSIHNEFKDSNVRGTLAMALSGSPTNPDSATNQWFFNLSDNSASLDPQKFTVFGKVVNSSSLSVMDAIGAEPLDTTDPSPNNSLPVINPAAGLTANNLIYVNSITLLNYPAPTVTISKPADNSKFKQGQVVVPAYSCADDGGPGLASCTGPKTVDTSLFGTFKYTVTATDDAGDTTSKSISYTVVPYFIPKSPRAKAPLLVPPYQLTRGGRVSLGLLCTAQVRCMGKLKLLTRRHHKLLASGHYSVGPGHTWEEKLRLNKAGRRLLRAGHGKLAMTVALTPAGSRHARKHRLTLRVK